MGGASGNAGAATFLSDEFDSLRMNLPMAVMGIEPMPRIADIASTLPAPATFGTAPGGP